MAIIKTSYSNTPNYRGKAGFSRYTGPGGIYGIINLEANAVYVGQTKSFQVRYKQHKQALADGTHQCRRLQTAYNVYGPQAFRFRQLEVIRNRGDKDTLLAREQYYMRLYLAEGMRLYNSPLTLEPVQLSPLVDQLFQVMLHSWY